MNQKLLTVKQAAEFLSVHERTIRDWIKAGKLAGVKLPGGDWRFRQDWLENWVERRTIKATKSLA